MTWHRYQVMLIQIRQPLSCECCIEDILTRFYSVAPYDVSPDSSTAQANPALVPYVPTGKEPEDIVSISTLLTRSIIRAQISMTATKN